MAPESVLKGYLPLISSVGNTSIASLSMVRGAELRVDGRPREGEMVGEEALWCDHTVTQLFGFTQTVKLRSG